MDYLLALRANSCFLAAVVLFIIGFHTMLVDRNLIKKIIGMNIMDTAVFLYFIASGYTRGGQAPIHTSAVLGHAYVNPVPSALILTGIVIAVSTTAFALTLIVRIYDFYGTLNTDEITKLRNGGMA